MAPLINIGSAVGDHTGTPGPRTWSQLINRLPNPDSTINAGSGDYVGTTEAKITLAIADAVLQGKKYVFVPQSMLPYNASLVTFNTAVLMLCEGATNPTEVNVRAYGAYGDSAGDDSAAFIAAIAYAGAQVEYFGTSLIATPPVVVPNDPSPQGQTKSYLITQTLALPGGLRMRGTGSYGALLQFKPANNSSTLFTFFGSVEAQTAYIQLENLFCYQNGTVQTSIGFRMRNCSFVQIRNCVFSNFRVGAWLDWGQDLECFDTLFAQNERGVQLGGDLTQTETPTPPAGVRGAPLQANPWLDNACMIFTKFSMNKIDVNHLGSNRSHGNTLVQNCTFFESSTSPVAGKTRFIHTTRLKGLMVQDSWFEAGADGRSAVVQSAFDFDGNAGDTNYGGVIQGNHFLLTGFTGGSSSVIPVDIESGSATISANVFETSSLAIHIKLNDNGRSSTVFGNAYLNYPDSLTTGRFTLNGVHQFLGDAGSAGQQGITVGKITADDPSVSQLQFNLAGVRKAGLNVIGPDTIRFFDSGGTVKAQLLLANGTGKGQLVPIVGGVINPSEAVLVSGVDVSAGNAIAVTLTAARLVGAPLSPSSGQRVIFTFIQGGAGGFAVTWNVIFKVSWSDTGNTTGKRSTISFWYDGTNWNQDGAQTPYV